MSVTEKIGTKDYVYKKIKEEGVFSHLIIPTGECSDFDDFRSFLQQHTQVILKPKNGVKGKNIYMVSITEKSYTLSYHQNEEYVSKKGLRDFFYDFIRDKQYIQQKYINSRNKAEDPFDCRIRLEKNGKGRWEVAVYLIRIGTNQKVTSNTSQRQCE
ncbi:glutathione synthase/RimK-type ligase-like ATP-grasp enzyme [Virgibacillus natechei]|uniref:Glutathione synthase/RimK-type ligase-like ATP-grasp enzyme n=1 Tax=Virgibacillus natechei TaxID=1216297 RepID=A0ABS4ILE9_9BACI|nr:YheC/YheD family protein [Virgibacillus natechei]MBP1971793.1 glutathione synthase/RimK-type ligase-like ATP-grasp enzyme [Virgibacillus natechei]UZD12526.1 YheC/YheD family protein [Virgibacillus natechei]